MDTINLFIGSSSEGYEAAEYLQLALDEFCDATTWRQCVFELSLETFASLVRATQEHDFAAFLLTPDDIVIKREQTRHAARDNLILEIGLFMGSLGQKRTFIIHSTDANIDIPTDIIALQRLTYRKRNNMEATMGTVATKVKKAISKVLNEQMSLEKDADLNPNELLTNFFKRIILRNPSCLDTGDLAYLYNKSLISPIQLKELGYFLQEHGHTKKG